MFNNPLYQVQSRGLNYYLDILVSSKSIPNNQSTFQYHIYDITNICNPYLSNIYYISDYSISESFINPFINDVQDTPNVIDTKKLVNTNKIINNDDGIEIEFNAKFPLFFINKNEIKVPSKVHRTIERQIPKSLLKEIHSNKDVAIEMCLIFLTQLNSTYFEIKDGSNPEGWKSLHAAYLRELISLNALAYKSVIKALCYPLNNGPILECDEVYIIGQKNFFYRLGKPYIGKGITKYSLQTKEAQKVLNKHYFRQYSLSVQNPICRNLINLYSEIQLPTVEQIKIEAKRLIKFDGGYTTKKGKQLKFLNKHTKDYFKDASNYSFVEDAVEIFEYLTRDGLMIPIEGGPNSGGRVVDSFTLMPSWIRNLIKINGQKIIECDYVALHPNIAVSLYGGTSKFLSHGDLQLELGMDLLDVKREHLSFFNKKVWQMKESPLYIYYEKNEPKMLENLISEKHTNKEYRNNDKHKITSKRMFKKEVEIMTEVIQILNNQDIYVLYVYDALYCTKKQVETVIEVMDSVVLKHGVHSTTKVTTGRKHNPITTKLKESKFDMKLVPNDEVLIVRFNELNLTDRIKDEVLSRINNGDEVKFLDAKIDFFGELVSDRVVKIHDDINPNQIYVTESYLFEKAR
jgi:hypothetical protein